jgi:hypothetical protein
MSEEILDVVNERVVSQPGVTRFVAAASRQRSEFLTAQYDKYAKRDVLKFVRVFRVFRGQKSSSNDRVGTAKVA